MTYMTYIPVAKYTDTCCDTCSERLARQIAAGVVEPMFECKLGAPTFREQRAHSEQECLCDASCEPHIHYSWGIECFHDGENDHGHCPTQDKS